MCKYNNDIFLLHSCKCVVYYIIMVLIVKLIKLFSIFLFVFIVSALNNSSFTPNPVVSTKSTAITPVSNSNDQSASVDKDCWIAIPTKLRV